MIMCIQNLVKLCPLILKICSKNVILESIKGHNSVAKGGGGARVNKSHFWPHLQNDSFCFSL